MSETGQSGKDMRERSLAKARAAFATGDATAAAEAAHALLRLHPDDPEILALLANCGAALSDPQMALRALAPLLRRNPSSAPLRRAAADAFNMLGSRSRDAGASAQALAHLGEATALEPDHRLAWFNTATVLTGLGRMDDAAAALARHLALCPDDEAAHLLAARLARAAAPLQAAAHIAALRSPAQLDAAFGIADALDRDGEADAARTAFTALAGLTGQGRRQPGLRAVLGSRLALPAVHADVQAMHGSRARFESGLGELEHAWDGLLKSAEPALAQIAWCNFKLAYQGLDDRPLQERCAALLRSAALRMFPQWRAPPTIASRGQRCIGLLSSGWRDCTVGAYFGGWIEWLRAAGYELRLYQLGTRDARTTQLGEAAGHLYHHSGPLEALAARVREDCLDLLLYPELGMDPRLSALAALRLAPRQAVAWGHPVTTGLASIDGYFSCAAMEPADAQAHYSEPLLLLPGLGVAHAAAPPAPPLSRAALGLPADAPLLLVPQSLFKLHPEFDALLARVAGALPSLRVVLFRAGPARWAEQVQQRLAGAFAAHGADAGRQLHWLPPQDRARYLAINAACDLMLDVPHWSGGNTALDALGAGLPILASPGRFMRGRQSAAMLAMLGLEEALVCADADALPERAIALLQDPTALARLRERIHERRPLLSDAGAAREAFLAHVAGLCSG